MEHKKTQNQEIKGYKILGKIAVGGMGEVFRGVHPALNKEVILKKLLPKAPDAFLERFKREAELMMEVSHPNIAHIFDYFKEGNASYIVMEYISGYNLSEFIKKFGKLPVYLAAYIACEIAKGLSYAHAKGIIHRDIKPGNALISLQGEIKLTDFGIAFKDAKEEKEDDDITKSGTLLGTPAYMSPEQIYSSKDVDKRTDIYSLGILFYEMLTGKRPYKNDFTMENILNIRKGKFVSIRTFNKNVPKSLVKIVKKMLSPKKEKRYKSVDEFINEINPFIMNKFRDQDFLKRSFYKLLTKEDTSKEIEYFKYPDIYLATPAISKIAAIFAIVFVTLFGSIKFFPGIFLDFLKIDGYGVAFIKASSYEKISDIKLDLTLIDSPKKRYRFETSSSNKNFITKNIVLPAGRYRALLSNYDKKVYAKEFFVYPFSDDKKLNILEFNIEKPLGNKVKIEAVVYDSYSTITKERYKIFYKKTEDSGWREYNSSSENILSGFSYDFSVLKEGYNIAILSEIFIPLNQDTLNLEFILTPKRSQIEFIKNDRDLNIFVNGKDVGFLDFNGIERKRYKFGKSFFIGNGINIFRFVDEKMGIDYEVKKEILKDRDYKLLFKLENNKPIVKIEILEK